MQHQSPLPLPHPSMYSSCFFSNIVLNICEAALMKWGNPHTILNCTHFKSGLFLIWFREHDFYLRYCIWNKVTWHPFWIYVVLHTFCFFHVNFIDNWTEIYMSVDYFRLTYISDRSNAIYSIVNVISLLSIYMNIEIWHALSRISLGLNHSISNGELGQQKWLTKLS